VFALRAVQVELQYDTTPRFSWKTPRRERANRSSSDVAAFPESAVLLESFGYSAQP
jgi:hypothetical protein